MLTTGRGRNIRQLSHHNNEDEVLLPPNSLFAVRSVGRLGAYVLVQLAEVAPLDPILRFGDRDSVSLVQF